MRFRQHLAGWASVAAWWLLPVSLLVFSCPAIHASSEQHTIRFTVRPFSADQVQVEAEGACGATCGIEVRWRGTATKTGLITGTARGIWAVLDVERDVPMLAMAEVRDRGGVIGSGGVRFVYDGNVHRLKG